MQATVWIVALAMGLGVFGAAAPRPHPQHDEQFAAAVARGSSTSCFAGLCWLALASAHRHDQTQYNAHSLRSRTSLSLCGTSEVENYLQLAMGARVATRYDGATLPWR